MWVALLLFTLVAQLSPPAHVRLVRDSMATVTGLTAVHRGGQTFLTGTKNAGATGSTTYAIRRSASAITSSSDGTLVATLTANSYRLLYNDDPGTITNGENLTTGFVVTDDGAHLASTKILLVFTTGVGETGTWNYAAFTSDDPTTVAAGVNTVSVAETYQVTPGAIHLGSSVVGSYTVHRYYAWRNYSTWVHGEWGYYGHRFNVAVPTSGSNFPILLQLHGGGTSGYAEPAQGGYLNAVTIQPFSPDFGSTTDPYTGGSRRPEWWLFQFDTAADLWKTSSMDRIVDYVKMVRDNATGDGVNFSVNPNRIYAHGASGGSSGMHVAAHNRTVFAAAMAGLPWLDNTAAGGGAIFPNPSKKVNSSGGETLAHYFDLAYQATQVALPPIIHVFGAMDVTVTPTPYPAGVAAFEANHQPYFVEWTNTDHDGGHDPSYAQWDANTGAGYLRFALNEAYPAFGDASTSDTLPASYPTHSTGQRNGYLDWQDSRHSISGGSAISDNASTFGISLISTSVAATCTVTLRNFQNFILSAGASVGWSTASQSGATTVNADGSVTIQGLNVALTATRLSLVAVSSPSPSSSPSVSASPSQSPSSSASPSPSPSADAAPAILPVRGASAALNTYNDFRAVTPSNTIDHAFVFDALYVGTAGNIVAVTTGGVAVTFAAAPAGSILRVRGRRVHSTGTTASNLVALRKV